MAYNEALDAQVASIVTPWGLTRMKMFGGTGYLWHGNMMAGVHGDRLVLRLSKEIGAAVLAQPFVRPFDMVPRPMQGWVMVEPEGLDGENLEGWLNLARTYVESLPPK